MHARKPALGSGGFAAVLSLDWLWLCGSIAASFLATRLSSRNLYVVVNHAGRVDIFTIYTADD
ncbi:hypothetical protein KXJ74_07865 [Acinetobacter johnsonii]|nr:hypothetical protein KXJ74_07865 [Acinetobacter johnsonii]